MIIDLLFLNAVEKRLDRERLARRVLERSRAAGITIATAESCTGGLVAAALTEIPGSSDVFDRGFVAYANGAKIRQLQVSPDLIASHGAVSEPVAGAMAEGALAVSEATVAVSVTGIAGPGGGTPDKPIGVVCFGLARRGAPVLTFTERFGQRSRRHIRARATMAALNLLANA